jgi:hypothetical protein
LALKLDGNAILAGVISGVIVALVIRALTARSS